MKFDWEENAKDAEPVAYIDHDGDLVLYPLFDGDVSNGISGSQHEVFQDLPWAPFGPGVQKIFYPGDTLTITF